MDVGHPKKGVCKTKNKHEKDLKRNKQFKGLIKIYYYGSRESKSIYSDTTVEVC